MGCFTADAGRVSETGIFARMLGEGRQLLVYQMTYAARDALALVLPLPVVPGTRAGEVAFHDLSGCSGFFAQLHEGFPELGRGPVDRAQLAQEAALAAPRLRVQEIGAWEASFVPRLADFPRLDERFRLPAPLEGPYGDGGFAVVQLRATTRVQVHPVALSFPTRQPQRLFFPTLHAQGGTIPDHAPFDHALYCQPEPAMHWHLHGWEESYGPVRRFLHCTDGLQLLDPAFPCWRARLAGLRRNEDSWLGRGAGLARPVQ